MHCTLQMLFNLPFLQPSKRGDLSMWSIRNEAISMTHLYTTSTIQSFIMLLSVWQHVSTFKNWLSFWITKQCIVVDKDFWNQSKIMYITRELNKRWKCRQMPYVLIFSWSTKPSEINTSIWVDRREKPFFANWYKDSFV